MTGRYVTKTEIYEAKTPPHIHDINKHALLCLLTLEHLKRIQ